MRYPIWSRSSFSGEVAKVLGIFWGIWGGLHLYRKNVTFIQQHTGIYTTTHWHLYNNTLAFIQVMSFIHFLLNSSWHSAMNGMQTNKMHAVHGRLLPNFSFFFPNSSWHSAMNSVCNLNACRSWQSAAQFFFFLPKLFMALCHEVHAQSKCMPFMAECCPIFSFLFFESIYTNPKLLALIQEKNMLAFIQEGQFR